jgi:hypothetical protein
MASVASQLVEGVTAHAQVAVSRMRERYAQTVLTFQITYVYLLRLIFKSKKQIRYIL